LILREMTPADVDPLLAVLGDPHAMRYFPAPYTRQGVEGWVSRNQERYGKDGFGLWTVVLKETGEVIGDCGLTRQLLQGQEELEIGYHVVPTHHGKGYATEAARACLAWAFVNTACDRVISFMGLDNLPSQGVASRVHARFLGQCGERAGIPHCHYGTTRAEFAGPPR